MNEIVQAINKALGETVFCVLYSETDKIDNSIYPPKRFTDIKIGLHYNPKERVIMSINSTVKTIDLDRRREEIRQSFNEMIITQLMFSKSSKGLFNSEEQEIISMVDIINEYIK